MKKIIITSLVLFAAFAANAQVSIGGKQSVEGTSTILDFNSPLTADTNGTTNNNFNGIILPAVENKDNALASDTDANNGTFLFDLSDNKIKMYEKGWKDLSGAGSSAQITVNATNDKTPQHGAIIGANTSPAKGVLVLESADKAMILPRIANPHETVKSPYPGMMCYDTVSKSMAVFDGTLWNYWK